MRVPLIVVCIYGMVAGACRYANLVVFHARLMVEWLQKNTGKLMKVLLESAGNGVK